MFEIILLILVIAFAWLLCTKCSKQERYDDMMPDPCVHMMETGFSNDTVKACQAYATKCMDTCEPYPVVTDLVNQIYNQLGLGMGNSPDSQADAQARQMLLNGACSTSMGPGAPCTEGMEECMYPYTCQNSACQCPPNPGY